jgi:hypothetical protein
MTGARSRSQAIMGLTSTQQPEVRFETILYDISTPKRADVRRDYRPPAALRFVGPTSTYVIKIPVEGYMRTLAAANWLPLFVQNRGLFIRLGSSGR